MAETSKIEWTDATVNFWWGCTKVGPGCDHCYAEAHDARFGGHHWGLGVPRRKIKSARALLHRLDNEYADWSADWHVAVGNRATGSPMPEWASRRRVFVQSMSDLFDLEVELDWFAEAWSCIEACDRIDLQILTKRISAVEKRLAAIGRTAWPRHAGLMITVVNQAEADRDVPRLLDLKAKLGIPWVGLSMEPLLGPVDLTRISHPLVQSPNTRRTNAMTGVTIDSDGCGYIWRLDGPCLDWIVAGGESGTGARPMHPAWARSLRDQCAVAGVPFFFKQWGEWLPGENPGDTKPWPPARWQDGEIGRHSRSRDDDSGPEWRHFGTPGEPGAFALRVGKKAAGALLDGVEHKAWPKKVPHAN